MAFMLHGGPIHCDIAVVATVSVQFRRCCFCHQFRCVGVGTTLAQNATLAGGDRDHQF